jgi:hypothetical protein
MMKRVVFGLGLGIAMLSAGESPAVAQTTTPTTLTIAGQGAPSQATGAIAPASIAIVRSGSGWQVVLMSTTMITTPPAYYLECRVQVASLEDAAVIKNQALDPRTRDIRCTGAVTKAFVNGTYHFAVALDLTAPLPLSQGFVITG